ncbi:MAG: hypothetical protein ACK559_14935 [bacterium]
MRAGPERRRPGACATRGNIPQLPADGRSAGLSRPRRGASGCPAA